MALSFKVFSVAVALMTLVSSQPKKSMIDTSLQADICEMIRDIKDDAEMRFPNEYYDCHAHGRYHKEASLSPSADGVTRG